TRAQLDGREHWLARGFAAVEGRRSNAVDAENANDLLHQVGLALDVAPPRRNGDPQGLAAVGDGEAEMAAHALGLAPVNVDTGQPRQFVERKIDDARGYLRRARDHDLRGFAAAEIKHHLGRKLEPRQHEGGIDPALESVAGVRIDAELAAGLRDVDRIPK